MCYDDREGISDSFEGVAVNEMAQDQPVTPKRRLWRVVVPLLLFGVVAFWWFRSRVDSRFVGTWEHLQKVDPWSEQSFEFRSSGTGELIAPRNQGGAIRWWYDGTSICFRPAKASLAGELIESFQTAFGLRRDFTMRLYVVKVDDSQWGYIEMGRDQTAPAAGARSRTAVRRTK
jgi:hypothetical protein